MSSFGAPEVVSLLSVFAILNGISRLLTYHCGRCSSENTAQKASICKGWKCIICIYLLYSFSTKNNIVQE